MRSNFRLDVRCVLAFTIVTLIALTIALCARLFVMEVYEVQGQSMMPTLTDGDRLLILKLSPIDRGDIVVLRAPDNTTKVYVKRVIGLPNETILLVGNYLFVDGVLLKENYINPDRLPGEEFIKIVCGPRQYAVLGDNRPNSHDSRSFGSVGKQAIVGEVICNW